MADARNGTATSGTQPARSDPAPYQDGAWATLATGQDDAAWLARTRVVLQPTAAPSIMGLFGFAIATLMVGAWQAGWYGNAATPHFLWPFTFLAGGVFQLIAAVACYRARDSMALAVHTAWGAFWMAWSLLQALAAVGLATPVVLGVANPDMAFWFIGLTVVTASAFLASLAQSITVSLTVGSLAAGSALTAAGFYGGSLGVLEAGGWLFVVSAAAAWLAATAMMLEGTFGRTIIPLGKYSKAANVPGRAATLPIGRREGMPGVRVGQ